MSGFPCNVWQRIKVIGFVLVTLNTHVFIVPAISDSVSFLRHGEQSLFEQAMLIEAIAGFANIVFIIFLVIVAVRKRHLLAAYQA